MNSNTRTSNKNQLLKQTSQTKNIKQSCAPLKQGRSTMRRASQIGIMFTLSFVVRAPHPTGPASPMRKTKINKSQVNTLWLGWSGSDSLPVFCLIKFEQSPRNKVAIALSFWRPRHGQQELLYDKSSIKTLKTIGHVNNIFEHIGSYTCSNRSSNRGSRPSLSLLMNACI